MTKTLLSQYEKLLKLHLKKISYCSYVHEKCKLIIKLTLMK